MVVKKTSRYSNVFFLQSIIPPFLILEHYCGKRSKMGKLKNIDVVVIGRSCMDYIAIVDQFPRENQKVPLRL